MRHEEFTAETSSFVSQTTFFRTRRVWKQGKMTRLELQPITPIRFSEYFNQFLEVYGKINSIFYWKFTWLYLIYCCRSSLVFLWQCKSHGLIRESGADKMFTYRRASTKRRLDAIRTRTVWKKGKMTRLDRQAITSIRFSEYFDQFLEVYGKINSIF